MWVLFGFYLGFKMDCLCVLCGLLHACLLCFVCCLGFAVCVVCCFFVVGF